MLRLAERSPALMLSFVRELSHRLREFNQQYVREVVQAERLAVIGRFARSIVHDLKNPLNIIGITSEMATMDNATPEYRHEAKLRIRRQVDRISDLISEILDFTQSTNANVVLAPTDYAEFIAGTNPTLANSRLKTTATLLPDHSLRLDWESVSGRIYRVEGSLDGRNWSPVSDWLQAGSSSMTFSRPPLSSGAPYLFRVEVRP
jgi:signal transduction histidine kinase